MKGELGMAELYTCEFCSKQYNLIQTINCPNPDCSVNTDPRHKRYIQDDLNRGCGYYSVCDGAGFECPCSHDAPVKQGFDPKVWENLRASRDAANDYDDEPLCLDDDDLDDDPYEDFDWEYD